MDFDKCNKDEGILVRKAEEEENAEKQEKKEEEEKVDEEKEEEDKKVVEEEIPNADRREGTPPLARAMPCRDRPVEC